MPLSQQLFGLIEESAGVKAFGKRSIRSPVQPLHKNSLSAGKYIW